MERLTITIIDKVGFSCYSTINIIDIADLGDTYDLITDDGDIFMEKDKCYIYTKAGGKNRYATSIEYKSHDIEVYIDDMDIPGEGLQIS